MKEKIRAYVHSYFTDMPNTRRASEVEDEIVANLSDKYDDFVNSGIDESSAYDKVIASIGDLDELISSLKDDNVFNEAIEQAAKKKTALVVTVCVALYICSLFPILIVEELFPQLEVLALLGFFLFCGTATCILIYHFLSRPKYKRVDNSMVEDFKEWKSNTDNSKALEKSVHSILWTTTVAVYLLISFIFQIWWISWIIFIIAAVVSNIIRLLFSMKR